MIDVDEVLSGRAGTDGVRALLRSSSRRQALRSLLASSVSLGPSRLVRLKYTPGRKLSAYYDVAVSGAPGRRRAVAVTWEPAGQSAMGGGTGDLRQSMASENMESENMESDARRRGLLEPFVSLAAVMPDAGLRLQVHPLDTGFPQLVRLVDPAYVSSMLARAGLGPARGASRAVGAVGAVRFRPGQRHVLRYRPPGGSHGPTVFAKLRRDDGAPTVRLTADVGEILAVAGGDHGGDHFGAAVAPAVHVPEDSVVLYPCAPGVPLSRLLRRGAEAGRHLERAGSVLRTLHRDGAAIAVRLATRPALTEIAVTRRAAGHIRRLLPEVGARIEELLARAASSLEAPAPGPETFAHGDYKADHLLVTRRGLTVIDLDSCLRAEPALDVGKFLADLRWWLADWGESATTAAQDRFLAGYGRPAPPLVARARIYEGVLLLRAAARRVRVDRVDWAGTTTALVDQAARVLAAPAP